MRQLLLIVLTMLTITAKSYGWQQVYDFKESGQDVWFFDENNGYVSADSLYKTTDGGKTWVAVDFSGQGLCFINQTIGFCGSEQTIDGGKTWKTNQSLNSAFNSTPPRKMRFIDSKNGLAVAPGGKVAKSADGGTTWTKLDCGTTETLNDCWIFDKDNMIVVGDENIIRKTIDGGKTWENKDITDLGRLEACYFINNDIGYVGGPCVSDLTSRIFKTIDGGNTWQKISTSVNWGWVNTYSIQMFDENNGVIGSNQSIYTTNDGWKTAQSQVKTTSYTNIFMLNQTSGYAINGDGKVYKLAQNSISDDKYMNATLLQNYPNPFNPTTNISFVLKNTDRVRLTIYDTTGREIIKLVDKNLSAGEHQVKFDGSSLNSGLYFYQLITPTQSVQKKMLLVK